MVSNIRLLRRRIKTAQNIAQITRAMEMVAVSKMRRAQERTLDGKPYSEKLALIAKNLIGRVERGIHPYLMEKERGGILLLLFSSDKGLCGSFNTNLYREFLRFRQSYGDIEVITIGKKLTKAVIRAGGLLIADFPFGTTLPKFEAVFPISSLFVEGFIKGAYRKIFCMYTQFISLGRQMPTTLTLLPVGAAPESQGVSLLPYTFEPNPGSLLTSLMPHYLEMSLYQIFLESYASEQAARMLAMHAASENAKDVIWELSLMYNKARQERITNELLDITGGTIGII